MTVNSLEALDRRHWVHPVANWASHEKRGVTIIKSARGAFVTDADGHELLRPECSIAMTGAETNRS